MSDDAYKPADGVEWTESRRVFRVTKNGGPTFRLSGTGYWLWWMITKHEATAEEIIEDCLAHWSGTRSKVAADVHAFISELLRENLIVPTRNLRAASPTAAGHS